VTNDAGARQLRVLLVAAARDMVGSSLAAVEAAGLRPTMVDLTSFAVLRSLVTSAGSFGTVTAEALVDVGASVTNIVVHEGGVPRFVRILLMGGGDMDYDLAQPGAVRVDRLVLSGGGSRLGGLAERLSSATRLPVELARPLSALKLGKTGLTDEQLAYVEPMVTVPVGLAMGVAS
jgi:type IV pilus assembly protein PilM